MNQTIETDVLVVGAGGAGCRAAIEAHDAGAKVTLAVKGLFGRIGGLRGSGATGATDSFGFFCSPDSGRYVYGGAGGASTVEEEREIFFNFALQVGLGMADRRLMRILVDEVANAKRRLKEWGVVVEDNEPFMRSYVAPTPGMACVIRGNRAINVVEHTMITKLVIQDGVCIGAVGINEITGDPVSIKTKAVILATGGAGQLYMHNFQPACVTGDGYSMAFEAGAELLNMEYQQVIWTVVYPTVNTLPGLTQARFLNANKEEFIQKYLPQGINLSDVFQKKLQHWPFTSRDISKYLDIAAVNELKAGRATEHNGFLISTQELKSSKKMVFRELLEWLKTHGVDLNNEFVEANVSYHCSHGGVRIDENGESTISGLYAVGEAAAGPYGVDRLGGCMMAFSQVFGTRAGKHAASRKKNVNYSMYDDSVNDEVTRILDLKKRQGKLKPGDFKKRLQKKTWENMLVVRNEQSLAGVVSEIISIRDEIKRDMSVETSLDLVEALELENMLKVGEIIAAAALERKESRGNHYRDDYPERNDTEWLHSTTLRNLDGNIKLGTLVRDPEWRDQAGDMKNLKWG